METPKLWAVCSISKSQYLKMRRAKLNTYTDSSGNLCACSPIRLGVTSRKHEISGASACRCRSCWPKLNGTQRWFLELEIFLENALHSIVDDRESGRSLRLAVTDHICVKFPRQRTSESDTLSNAHLSNSLFSILLTETSYRNSSSNSSNRRPAAVAHL